MVLDETASRFDSETRECLETIRLVLKDYPGYGRVGDRRLSDDLLRAHLVRCLQRNVPQIRSLEVYFGRMGPGSSKSAAARVTQSAETILDKVQASPCAFSLFFTADWLPDSVQADLVRHDAETLEVNRRLQHLLEPTLGGEANYTAVLDNLAGIVASLDERLEQRLSAIMEFQG